AGDLPHRQGIWRTRTTSLRAPVHHLCTACRQRKASNQSLRLPARSESAPSRRRDRHRAIPLLPVMHPLSRLVLLCVPLLVCGSLTSAHAIEPSRAIAQYIRERWGPDRGFPGEEVRAITQTSDGYLWIGTDRGLVRFDGLSFRLVSGSDARSIEAVGVLGLAADADGGLWIRVQGRRLLRYRGGTFEDAIWPISPREMTVTTINLGNNGDVLFAGIVNGVLRFHAGGFAHLAAADLVRRSLVTAITEDHVGNVWLGTHDNGLLCLSAGQVTSLTKGLPAKR